MIDSINKYVDKTEALLAFAAAGLTFVDPDGVERIRTADINGVAICEVGELFTMTSPGTPGDPLDPPVYVGDGFHWVVYRHLNEETLPAALQPATVWNSKMVDAQQLAVPRPTDGSVPNQFWL
jgi:hypothetical protein